MTTNLHASSAMETRETHELIGSDKVGGTAVYRSNGEKIGSIARVMIGKRSGKVGYAVMGCGGVLGIGEDYYPLPWSLLTYNPGLGGYAGIMGEAAQFSRLICGRAWTEAAVPERRTGLVDGSFSRKRTTTVYKENARRS
jgi:hypothetical protein